MSFFSKLFACCSSSNEVRDITLDKICPECRIATIGSDDLQCSTCLENSRKRKSFAKVRERNSSDLEINIDAPASPINHAETFKIAYPELIENARSNFIGESRIVKFGYLYSDAESPKSDDYHSYRLLPVYSDTKRRLGYNYSVSMMEIQDQWITIVIHFGKGCTSAYFISSTEKIPVIENDQTKDIQFKSQFDYVEEFRADVHLDFFGTFVSSLLIATTLAVNLENECPISSVISAKMFWNDYYKNLENPIPVKGYRMAHAIDNDIPMGYNAKMKVLSLFQRQVVTRKISSILEQATSAQHNSSICYESDISDDSDDSYDQKPKTELPDGLYLPDLLYLPNLKGPLAIPTQLAIFLKYSSDPTTSPKKFYDKNILQDVQGTEKIKNFFAGFCFLRDRSPTKLQPLKDVLQNVEKYNWKDGQVTIEIPSDKFAGIKFNKNSSKQMSDFFFSKSNGFKAFVVDSSKLYLKNGEKWYQFDGTYTQIDEDTIQREFSKAEYAIAGELGVSV